MSWFGSSRLLPKNPSLRNVLSSGLAREVAGDGNLSRAPRIRQQQVAGIGRPAERPVADERRVRADRRSPGTAGSIDAVRAQRFRDLGVEVGVRERHAPRLRDRRIDRELDAVARRRLRVGVRAKRRGIRRGRRNADQDELLLAQKFEQSRRTCCGNTSPHPHLPAHEALLDADVERLSRARARSDRRRVAVTCAGVSSPKTRVELLVDRRRLDALAGVERQLGVVGRRRRRLRDVVRDRHARRHRVLEHGVVLVAQAAAGNRRPAVTRASPNRPPLSRVLSLLRARRAARLREPLFVLVPSAARHRQDRSGAVADLARQRVARRVAVEERWVGAAVVEDARPVTE